MGWSRSRRRLRLKRKPSMSGAPPWNAW
uniref:Uncharacterized protein n=1 Tax=Arundo donax TaxID=35708 RepID=A0A0A8YAG6_ARUDO